MTRALRLRIFASCTLLGVGLIAACGDGDKKKDREPDRAEETDDDDTTDAPARAKGRSTPNGDPSKFPFGYYDVTARGVKNDFCQVARGAETLECDTGSKVLKYAAKLDLGYPGTAKMEDANGDGRDDLCRCVGDGANIRYACLLTTAGGFAEDQYGFVPPGRADCQSLTPPKAAEPPPVEPPPAPTAEVPAAPPPPPPAPKAPPAPPKKSGNAPGCSSQGQFCVIDGSMAGLCMDFSGSLLCGNPTGSTAHHDGCMSRGQGCTCSNTGRRGTCNTGPHKKGFYCRCD